MANMQDTKAEIYAEYEAQKAELEKLKADMVKVMEEMKAQTASARESMITPRSNIPGTIAGMKTVAPGEPAYLPPRSDQFTKGVFKLPSGNTLINA